MAGTYQHEHQKTQEQDLSEEISRIIESPYPTQLQTLLDLLRSHETSIIDSWASNYPCQIPRLVEEVLHALPQWKYVTDIVTKLAHNLSIRNELLKQEPSLLSWALASSPKHFLPDGQHSLLVEALLSHPLPTDCALPADTQQYLQCLFKHVSQVPTQDNVHRLERLFWGGCIGITKDLPDQILVDFENQMLVLLRDRPNPEQQATGLSCLAVMAAMCNNCHTRDSISAFFRGAKALKTMHLAILQMMTLCTTIADDASHIAQQCRSVITVVAAIDKDVRAEWCSKNGAMLRKLYEKAGSSTCGTSVQLFMLELTSIINLQFSIPGAAAATFETSLSGEKLPGLAANETVAIMEAALPVYLASEAGRGFIGHATRIVTQAYQGRSTSTVTLRRLVAVLESATRLEARTLDAVELLRDQQPLIIAMTEEANKYARRGVASTACQELATDRLLSAATMSLIYVILQLAFACSNTGQAIDGALVNSLLSIHRHQAMSPACARHTIRKNGDFKGLHATPAVSANESASGWRNDLVSILHSGAERERYSIEAFVSVTCRDLEMRCESIEAPLRAAKAEIAELETKYSEMEAAYGQVESSLIDQQMRAAELEVERDSAVEDTAASTAEIADLRTQLEESQNRYTKLQRMRKEENEDTEKRIRELENRLQETEEQLQKGDELAAAGASKKDTTISTMQDQLTEARLKIQQAESATIAADGDMRKREAENAGLTSRIEHLESDLAAARDERRRQQEVVEAQRSTISRVETSEAALRQTMEELKVSLVREKDAFLAEYRESAEHARAEWQNEKHSLQNEIATLEKDQADAELRHADVIAGAKEQLGKEIRKSQKLQKYCAKLEAQVAEVQEMRNRLMSAMGMPVLPAPVPIAQSALPIRSASSTAQTPARLPTTPAASLDEVEGVKEVELSVSSIEESNERTPKRSKPRKSVQVQMLKPSDTSRRRSVRSAVQERPARQPLTETSTNVSPKRRTSPGKVAFKDFPGPLSTGEDDLEIMNQWSFMEGAMQGTPALAGNGFDDDTTEDL